MLVTLGLIVVLTVGSPTSDSKPVKTATSTQPRDVDETDPDGPGAGTVDPTTTSVSPDVTMPDGSPAPDGASSVHHDDGVLTINFAVDKSQLSSTVIVKVPPMTARSADGPAQLALTIGCSASRREQLSQVIVTETDESVKVSAVVLVPTNATGCNPDEAPTLMTLPLASPLDGRALSVESEDLHLPTINLDTIDD